MTNKKIRVRYKFIVNKLYILSVFMHTFIYTKIYRKGFIKIVLHTLFTLVGCGLGTNSVDGIGGPVTSNSV